MIDKGRIRAHVCTHTHALVSTYVHTPNQSKSLYPGNVFLFCGCRLFCKSLHIFRFDINMCPCACLYKCMSAFSCMHVHRSTHTHVNIHVRACLPIHLPALAGTHMTVHMATHTPFETCNDAGHCAGRRRRSKRRR